MTDKLGRIWLIGLLLALIVLSVYLWQAGKTMKEPSRETYLYAEAEKQLGCRPYLISAGVSLDANKNQVREYLFSCDSALTAAHRRFIWMEVRQKKVHILLWHTEEGFKVGSGPAGLEAVSWLIDRAGDKLLALPVVGDTFAEPLEIVWDRQKESLSLAAPSD